jgi:ribosomal protein S18 acetylase RimI-like enzyme
MIRNGTDRVEPLTTRHGVVRLRPETAEDTAFLYTLHESVKGAELALTPLPDAMRRHLLDMQFRAMTQGYHAMFPAARFEVVTLDDVPVGRLITDTDQHRFHIVHIALLPQWRGQGISTALMTAVLDEPRRHGIRCEAMVALDNLPSQRLWSRLGFSERSRGQTDLVMEWRPG